MIKSWQKNQLNGKKNIIDGELPYWMDRAVQVEQSVQPGVRTLHGILVMVLSETCVSLLSSNVIPSMLHAMGKTIIRQSAQQQVRLTCEPSVFADAHN